VSARRRELVDALRLAHAEAARLSEIVVVLLALERHDSAELSAAKQEWQIASNHAMQLHAELRLIAPESD
jgi:hypothetical protein